MINSGTSVSADFAYGVPLSIFPIDAVLQFRLGTDPDTGLIAANTQQIMNAPGSLNYPSSMDCSFAGGCQIEITAPGLKETLYSNPEENYITICGNNCELDVDSSTGSIAYCNVPTLLTDYSVSNFNLGADGKLSGTMFSSGDATELAKLTDDNTMNSYTDASNPCHFGM